MARRVTSIGTGPAFDPPRATPRFIRMIETLQLPNGYFPD